MSTAPSVTVSLPQQLSKFSGRHLNFDQMQNLATYCANTSDVIDEDVAFDGGNFTGIIFDKSPNGKYSVWALHDSLIEGPEFYINPQDPPNKYVTYIHNKELHQIVAEYLNENSFLGLTIDQFM